MIDALSKEGGISSIIVSLNLKWPNNKDCYDYRLITLCEDSMCKVSLNQKNSLIYLSSDVKNVIQINTNNTIELTEAFLEIDSIRTDEQYIVGFDYSVLNSSSSF